MIEESGGRKTGDADEENPRDGSFADLLGEAKPLDRGAARHAPAPPRPRAQHRPADDEFSGRKFRWPDPDDRHRAAADGVSDRDLLALGRGETEPLERIDLHGTRREAAGRLLTKRLESACAQGHDCVIVIHGRGQHSSSGEAVLRDALPGWLTRGANAQRVLAFAPAPGRLGGLGATLVRLRQKERQR